ncbi:GNAT family N-acetyltransferase [Paenibacillus sp. S28]|uniref:GNAT family N-acetyltransferase n=1 Tax=Paenibacillus sp. S28 TaxID=2767463 RepID=UPI00190E4E0A|nr:GNAT family N-acetyltransferase [Paenibacillus sp. S28]MBJ9989356.1 GNAT family N-acetyltransferase [Paenibacillus sp. S28]
MQSELSMMRLETERLIIRPYIESDLMEAFELMQNPELFTYMHMGVLSFEEYKGLFKWLIDSYNTSFNMPFKYSFAIRTKATDAFIGWCGVGVLDLSAPDKELYYLIGRDYWGNGYATEAASALTAYAFNVIGLDKLFAKANSQNTASIGVFRKLGFVFERELMGLTGDYEECNGELLHVLTKERFRKQAEI